MTSTLITPNCTTLAFFFCKIHEKTDFQSIGFQYNLIRFLRRDSKLPEIEFYFRISVLKLLTLQVRLGMGLTFKLAIIKFCSKS